jgi:hypothetical protein
MLAVVLALSLNTKFFSVIILQITQEQKSYLLSVWLRNWFFRLLHHLRLLQSLLGLIGLRQRPQLIQLFLSLGRLGLELTLKGSVPHAHLLYNENHKE